ncbi:MAG TPA: TonB-dependent receptor, partial [Bacteroidales bacterium]|nr:TonB-dependent receptor [Bacteroidales bacterium]
RAGWGQLGNQEVRNMAYVSTISPNPSYAFGSYYGSSPVGLGIFETGAAMFSFPNPDLKWEKTSTTNIGFDAVLFTNLSFSLEYYDKTTDGILQETSIPPSVGSKNNPVANIAKVKNNGFETTIEFQKSIGNFSFNVGGNLTTVHNEVLSTYNNIPFGTNDQRIETGYPIHYIYGYELDGIFQTQAEIDQWQLSHSDLTISQSYQPGDMYFKDVNGAPNPDLGYEFYTPMPDSVVNDFDRTYLGKTIPGFFYGFHFGANWKGFDFSAFFQGVGDVMKYNSARASLENLGTRGNNMRTTVLDAWTDQNHSTTMPRAIVGDPNHNARYSSRYVESAAYLRLGNAQIGYSIPPSLMNKLNNPLQSLRVYGSVSNAFVITQWDGLDPENDYSPVPRVFTIGLSARF